jgi:hypothetical protein
MIVGVFYCAIFSSLAAKDQYDFVLWTMGLFFEGLCNYTEHLDTVACLLKDRIVKIAETAVARER